MVIDAVGLRDYQALLQRIRQRLIQSADRVALKRASSMVFKVGDEDLWAQHGALIGYAGRLVAQWQRELDAEPGGYRAQASAVELANALGVGDEAA